MPVRSSNSLWLRHTCIYARVRVSKPVYVYLRIYTCIYACLRVSTHVFVCLRMCKCIYACVRVPTHVHVYLRKCKFIHACVRKSTLAFPYCRYLLRKWRLKMGHFAISLHILRVTPNRVFNAHKRNLYHMTDLDFEYVVDS